MTDIFAPLGKSTTYVYPTIIDPESNPTSFVSTTLSTGAVLPSFITPSATGLQFNPTLMSDVSVYTIEVKITDSTNNPIFTFVLTVTNEAPKVTSTIPSDVTVTFGTDFIYNFPTSIDPENLPFTTSIVSGPAFATVISNN